MNIDGIFARTVGAVRRAAPLAALLIAGTAFGQAAPLYPNLRALPASDIAVVENFGGVVELRFTSSYWNAGDGPLELIAGEIAQGRQFVYQRIYDDQGGYQDHLAGKFVWHQGHNHFHFEDFALYTLQAVTGNSKRSSQKTSFCLMDSLLVDGSLPGAPHNAAYDSCGNFFQGISVGWADVYGSALPGQSIDLTRMKDGDYRLIMETDPKSRLLETDEGDNVACSLIRLSVTNQTVEILNPDSCDEGGTPPPGGGSETVTAITPNSAGLGETIAATIDGTGFTAGLAIGFTNGKGPGPSVVDAEYLSDTQILVTITVKKAGKITDPVWDLNVGNATLADAFTVTQ